MVLENIQKTVLEGLIDGVSYIEVDLDWRTKQIMMAIGTATYNDMKRMAEDRGRRRSSTNQSTD